MLLLFLPALAAQWGHGLPGQQQPHLTALPGGPDRSWLPAHDLPAATSPSLTISFVLVYTGDLSDGLQ